MAKLTPAQMKKAVEEFKKKFTGGFLHASPSPSIKKFDPSKGDKAMPTEGVTFVTRDSDFADSFLGMHRNGKLVSQGAWDYDKGSTVYPLNVNLGKHFVPGSPEGKVAINEFVKNLPADPDVAMSAAKRAELLQSGAWDVMEDPRFLQYLQDTGHDTFTVMEGGVPNVGIFDPKNIRGKFAKFNPEDAESADFMKAEGGAVEGYAPGGKVVKKFLEHARQVPFVHYSNAPNISTLDPNRYGTGIKGAEAGRLKNQPDIRPRTFIYTKAGGRQPEQGLGPHKYEGVADDLYPLHDDPAGFSAMAKQKAIDPYMMQFGREVVDEATHLNELERLIKKAGYKGYANDDVGLLFDPTPVMKAE